MSSRGGMTGHFARMRLLSGYSCDVSSGAVLLGALSLPHPLGIVIGKGVQILGPATIYQGVTLGASKGGRYPLLHGNNRIFPNSVLVGGITIHARSTIGAGLFIDFDVAEGQVVRGERNIGQFNAESR